MGASKVNVRLYRLIAAILAGSALCLGMSSCDYLSSIIRPDKVVAKSGGAKLTEADLKRNLDLTGLSSEDSVAAIEMYIKDWASNNLMYELSRDQISDEHGKEIDSLVENYRQSLYVYEYELKLIKEKLSSQITDQQMYTYYNDNPSLFYLHEPLLKGVVMSVVNNASDYSVLKSLMESPSESNMEIIETLCVKNAAKIEYFTDNWTLMSDVMKKSSLPIHETDFKENKLYEETDSIKSVFLYVSACKLAGEQQPFEFAKNRIHSILTEQKKADFLRAYRNGLYEKGLQSGSVKCYK